MPSLRICLIIITLSLAGSLEAAAETAPLWNQYVESKSAGTEPVLPDFSHAGYHFSELSIPDVSDRPRFDVTDYGAIPNDEQFDDEAIQKAIDAAEATGSGGIVFFPPGKYLIAPDENRRTSIRISKSDIVLKGSGAGDGGTEIFADKQRTGRRQFQFRARDGRGESRDEELTEIIQDAPRETFWVEVADSSKLSVGQDVVIRHQSEEFTRLYFAPLDFAPEWKRLVGRRGGMNIAEIHTIAQIDGHRVRFANPIHFNLRLVKSRPFTLRTYRGLRECGVEDIRFTGHWDSIPEEFVHHKNATHDSGWCALSMENVADSWIRRCEFRNWNECVFTRNAYRMTIEDVNFTGKKGHAAIHARGGFGTLIRHCGGDAGHHHGFGGGYSSVNLVVTECQLERDQNIDLHSGQSYACLFDDIEGGIFRNIGGPAPGLPHAGRDLVFWNFRHRSTFDFTYNFWDTEKRRNHTFAEPVFVGFQADHAIKFENEGRNEQPGEIVEPRSLFEAQLELRLKKST